MPHAYAKRHQRLILVARQARLCSVLREHNVWPATVFTSVDRAHSAHGATFPATEKSSFYCNSFRLC
eukprot:1683551-Prymnesium_polylepis.1